MELDSKNLGRLRRVANARDVWASESGEFTPWLAENIDVLADALGMGLTVIGTELPVGDCRLDIEAEDHEGRVVVIENQLERTDHIHLGQCLVYASGLGAAAVVWISSHFREDFRRALDWLNERTDVGINFFGVEVGVVQIDEVGPRAPVFDVVVRPNGWQKAVKAASGASVGQATVTALNAQRQDFFGDVLAEVIAGHPTIRMPARGRLNWVSFASGPFGSWGLSVAGDGRLRIEAYLDTGDKEVNKQLFDEFAEQAATWEATIGVELAWERLNDKRASRIATYHPLVLDDAVAREAAKAWAVAVLSKMFDLMNQPLRTRARELRAAASANQDAAEGAAHDAGDDEPGSVAIPAGVVPPASA